jgi:sodium/bile acid cotransporter 7
VILLIIFKSFAKSFEENVFANVSIADLALLSVAVLGLFSAVYVLIGYLAGRMGFVYEDGVTARFCGTKKSLVHGTVFLKIIFGASPVAGVIIVPLMIFHAVQILIISVIASRLAKSRTEVK